MKSETFRQLMSVVFFWLFVGAVLAIIALAYHGCVNMNKEEKILAKIDSIEKQINKNDSAIVVFCDTLENVFVKHRAQFYEDDFDMADEDPQDVGKRAASALKYIRQHLHTDLDDQFEELRDYIKYD